MGTTSKRQDRIGSTARRPVRGTAFPVLVVLVLASVLSTSPAQSAADPGVTGERAWPGKRPITLLLTSGLGGQLADAGRTVAGVVGTLAAEAERAREAGRGVAVLDLGRTVTPYAESRWDGGATMHAALGLAGVHAWAPDPMDLSLGLAKLRALAAGGGVPILLPAPAAAAAGPGFEEVVSVDLGDRLVLRVRSLLAADHRGALEDAGLPTPDEEIPESLGGPETLDVLVVHSNGTGRETSSRRLTWALFDEPRGADLLLDPDMGHDLEASRRAGDGTVVLVGRDRDASPWTVTRVEASVVRRPGGALALTDLAVEVFPVGVDAPADPGLDHRALDVLARFHDTHARPVPDGAPTSPEELRVFALEAMREATRSEVAILPRGAFRPVADRHFASGRPTEEAVLRMLSIDQRLEVVELTGAELVALAGTSAGRVRRDGTPRSDALAILGLDPGAGEVNGRPLVAGDLYRVVTTRYLLAGGDGYEVPGRPIEDPSAPAPELRDDVVVPRLRRAAVPFADPGRHSLWRVGVDPLSLTASGVETDRDPSYEGSTDSRARAVDSTHVAARLGVYAHLDRTRWRWENRLDARFGLVEIEGVREEVDDDLRFDTSVVFPKTKVLGGSPYAGLLVDTEIRHEAGSAAERQLEESLSAGISWSTPRWPLVRLGVVGRHYSGVDRASQLGVAGRVDFHWPAAGRRPGLDATLRAERLEEEDSSLGRLDLELRLLFPVIGNLSLTPGLDLYLLDDSRFAGSARYTRLSLGLAYTWKGRRQGWGS